MIVLSHLLWPVQQADGAVHWPCACAQDGEPSAKLWQEERRTLLESLKKRSRMLADTLSKMEGVTINCPEGALYAMPRIRLPKKAVQVHCPVTHMLHPFGHCCRLALAKHLTHFAMGRDAWMM